MLTPAEIQQIIALEDVLIAHVDVLMKHAPDYLRASVVIREDIARLKQAPHRCKIIETED